MKQTTVINGVTLTREQVEAALKDLNTPDSIEPGSVWRSNVNHNDLHMVVANDSYTTRGLTREMTVQFGGNYDYTKDSDLILVNGHTFWTNDAAYIRKNFTEVK